MERVLLAQADIVTVAGDVKSTVETGVQIAGIAIMVVVPGPDDAVFAALASKYGIRALIREGKEILGISAKTGEKVVLGSEHAADAEKAYDAAKAAGKEEKACGEAASAADAARLGNELTAKEIAGGHAFDKHVIQKGEFPGITTREQFAAEIERVINNPSEVRHLSGGRTAYWDDASGTVVIRNPSSGDGGSAFRPTQGRTYFHNLH